MEVEQHEHLKLKLIEFSQRQAADFGVARVGVKDVGQELGANGQACNEQSVHIVAVQGKLGCRTGRIRRMHTCQTIKINEQCDVNLIRRRTI